MSDIQAACDRYESAADDLREVVNQAFPFESVARCAIHSNQFAIVMKPYDCDPSHVRCLLENDAVVEWHVLSLHRISSKKEWPTWVKQRLAERKRRRATREKEYGRVTGERR